MKKTRLIGKVVFIQLHKLPSAFIPGKNIINRTAFVVETGNHILLPIIQVLNRRFVRKAFGGVGVFVENVAIAQTEVGSVLNVAHSAGIRIGNPVSDTTVSLSTRVTAVLNFCQNASKPSLFCGAALRGIAIAAPLITSSKLRIIVFIIASSALRRHQIKVDVRARELITIGPVRVTICEGSA